VAELPDVSPAAERSPRWRRVVVKLSGEALMGSSQFGIDANTLGFMARQVERVVSNHHVEVAIVVGGGNIVRGLEVSSQGVDRVTGDYMGMLATMINALALRDALERRGLDCRVQTAIEMHQVAEPYIRGRAIRHLEKGRVVILGAGTGNPFFTTDTTASLRAAEIGAEGVRLPHLTYLEVLNRGLEVMDNTALTLCMDNRTPIVVFDLLAERSIERVILGEDIGTLVDDGGFTEGR